MNTIRILVVMSLMGSIVMAFYGLIKLLFKHDFLTYWKKLMIKLSCVYFLLPFPLLKNYYSNILPSVIDQDAFGMQANYANVPLDDIIFVVENEYIISLASYSQLKILLIIWIIGLLINLIRLTITYKFLKKRIFNYSILSSNENLQNIVHKYKRELNLKRNVSIRYSSFIDTPMTFGLFVPVILIPINEEIQNNIQFIIQHELIHIQHNDFFNKMLCLAVCIIHWYNPLSYLLSKEMTTLCEFHCDEAVVLNMNNTQRVAYGMIILEMATTKNKHLFINPISFFCYSSERILKERMIIVKTSKPAKKIQYFISIVTVITTVSLSSLSVLAFDEHIVTEATTVYLEEGETVFSSINDNEITAITINLPNEVGVTCYVIDTEGNITIINENNQKVFCDHNYKDITYVMHTKYSDGSCREVYYDAQRCFNCDRVIVGDEINTITYKKCIH